MAVNQSYVGAITNPIVEARLKVAFSNQALAKKLGLSKQYLSRAEQGTYSSLNPALLRWVSNVFGWTPESTTARYEQFQRAQRRETYERHEPHKLERHGSTAPGGEIFANWRNGYWTSPLQFAIAFCVHPDMVSRYEEGIQKSMPKQIRNALREVNLLETNWTDEPIVEKVAPRG